MIGDTSVPPVQRLGVAAPWTADVLTWSRCAGELRLHRGAGVETTGVVVRLERPAAGRLRAAYPAGAHDIEIRILDAAAPTLVTECLDVLTSAILAADSRCRRVVVAAPADDPDLAAAAEAAGFRHVVDVDIPNASLSLLVAEPGWVTQVDMDLDKVPGT
jgi:hypothetical protein